VKSLLTQLRTHFDSALIAAFGEAGKGVDPLIKAAGDAKFGDYQSNVAMSLAKKLGQKPRDVAQKLVDTLLAAPGAFAEMCDPPEIAGPGFINLRLNASFLQSSLAAIPPAPEAGGSAAADPTLPTSPTFDRLGIEPVRNPERQTVVIDLSSPNVAKQMHVGHLRSTIIGDTLARAIEFEGHNVLRQNHIGDWGTQFGIILEELDANGLLRTNAGPDDSLTFLDAEKWPGDPAEWEAVYKAGNAKMADPEFASRARQAVTRLQSQRSTEYWAWRIVTEHSMVGVIGLYQRLNVLLDDRDTCGESFYNPLLAGVVKELQAALGTDSQSAVRGSHSTGFLAVCREDQGAICVFLEKPDGTPAFKGPQGDPLPMILRKSDGAYLYATTDLAALAYRIHNRGKQPIKLHTNELEFAIVGLKSLEPEASSGGLGADRILYVVGAPQKLHFEMLFATARALGWTRPGNRTTDVELQHVPFGSVLGEDRKMLRTRSGQSVKLKDLLDEAVARAEKLVRDTEADPDKRRGFSEDEIRHIAETVGIAAVKYADLCQNRNTDYVFSWDKMLALQGNTAPYMLYAYARIRSIYRKGAESEQSASSGPQSAITVAHPAERALALTILRLAETIDAVADTLLPNILCEYLYDLAGRFMTFYESCPVLQAPDAATRASRLALCDLTARALRLGLALLGIRTLDRM
jgi:arginyl-tRNA synthetase